MKAGASRDKPASASLIIIGLGNIGSQLVSLIAFYRTLKRVVLVDRDAYEPTNLASQAITRKDVGRAKAHVQAERLQRLNTGLEVKAIYEDIAHIGPGRLRGSLIVSCVDSLESRIRINQIAWALGIPWLDGAVDPPSHLVRVSCYVPQPLNPCFECALTEEDYFDLGSSMPCQRKAHPAPPTNGPASLGALAGAVLAAECDKLLNGRFDNALVNKQLILGTEHHSHMINNLCQNARCRFGHVTWQMQSLKGLLPQWTLERALRAAERLAGPEVSLAIPNGAFTTALRCPGCGNKRNGLHFLGRLTKKAQTCHRCGRQLLVSGMDLLSNLDVHLPERIRRLPLRRLGIQAGDIFEVTGQSKRFWCEVGCAAESSSE